MLRATMLSALVTLLILALVGCSRSSIHATPASASSDDTTYIFPESVWR